jgi:hypothetical protein
MNKISDVQRGMLVRLGQFARNTAFFTTQVNGYQGLAPKIAERNLSELELAGYVIPTKTGWKLTQAGRNRLDSAVVVQKARINNGSSRLPYVQPTWEPARAEADDHQRYFSAGNSAQLTRAV